MPDAGAYPLLRPRRRRRARVDAWRLRRGVVLILAFALVGGAVWASRPGPPDPRRALTDALTTLEAGNYSAARSNALRAVSAAPRSAAAQAVLARAHLELGDGIAAEAALGRARDAGMPASRLHQLLARARLFEGDPAGALIEANRATPRYAGHAARVRAEALAA